MNIFVLALSVLHLFTCLKSRPTNAQQFTLLTCLEFYGLWCELNIQFNFFPQRALKFPMAIYVTLLCDIFLSIHSKYTKYIYIVYTVYLVCILMKYICNFLTHNNFHVTQFYIKNLVKNTLKWCFTIYFPLIPSRETFGYFFLIPLPTQVCVVQQSSAWEGHKLQ